MNWYYREPTLGEILSDSIIGAVMAADGVDRHKLEATLRHAGMILSTAQDSWRRPPQSEACGRPTD
jgi:hypothetical protein